MKISALSPAILVVLVGVSGVPREAVGAIIYGVAVEGATQSLVTWDSAAPAVLLSSAPITGLPTGETICGIKFDPAYFPGHQFLFAIGTGNGPFANVYRVSQLNGVATKLSGGRPANASGEHYGVTSCCGGRGEDAIEIRQ